MMECRGSKRRDKRRNGFTLNDNGGVCENHESCCVNVDRCDVDDGRRRLLRQRPSSTSQRSTLTQQLSWFSQTPPLSFSVKPFRLLSRLLLPLHSIIKIRVVHLSGQ